MHNPRIDDIATRVDTLQLEGIPFLVACSKVAESLEISISVVDSCYGAALTGDYSDMVIDPDPYDVSADWLENLDTGWN